MDKLLKKSMFLFGMILNMGLNAYSLPDAPPPLDPVYEPELKTNNNIFDLQSDIYQNTIEYFYFIKDWVGYHSTYSENSYIYRYIASELPKLLVETYNGKSYKNYTSIDELLRDYASKSAEKKKAIEKKLTDIIMSSAKYKSEVGQEPIALSLYHSNQFASTVLTWDDQSEHFECYYGGFYAKRKINGEDVSYWVEGGIKHYSVSPQYDIYRVIDGVESKILTIKQNEYFLGKDEISINPNKLGEHWQNNVKGLYGALKNEKNIVSGKVMHIDNLSEQYLHNGNRISYKIVATLNKIGHDCGDRRTSTSVVYFDYDADGIIDFAPTRLGWLVPVLYTILN